MADWRTIRLNEELKPENGHRAVDGPRSLSVRGPEPPPELAKAMDDALGKMRLEFVRQRNLWLDIQMKALLPAWAYRRVSQSGSITDPEHAAEKLVEVSKYMLEQGIRVDLREEGLTICKGDEVISVFKFDNPLDKRPKPECNGQERA